MASTASSTVNVRDFKRAMSRFASGVNVLTVADESQHPYGMTLSAFCSVSLDPLLVLVCVNRKTRTHDLVLRHGRFGVSVLSRGAIDVSHYCAEPGADKHLPAEWLDDIPQSRTPVLRDSLVHADCAVYATQRAGTHTIVVGSVEHISFGSEGDPLLYYRGTYRRLA
jgi:flavin reductase (DIM6/NTAB) family NADH-FMN oxidoreductase RutF